MGELGWGGWAGVGWVKSGWVGGIRWVGVSWIGLRPSILAGMGEMPCSSAGHSCRDGGWPVVQRELGWPGLSFDLSGESEGRHAPRIFPDIFRAF